MGRDAWGQEVGGRPLLTIERRGGGKEEGHGEELMAIPPIQKLKRDDGVRRMLAAPQPTRIEKESKEDAGRPPTSKKGEGEKEAKHGECWPPPLSREDQEKQK